MTDAGASVAKKKHDRRGLDSRRSDGARSRGVFRHRQICWSGCATLDPAKNASPGFIKFMRAGLKCKKDYGDGDSVTPTAMIPPLLTSEPTKAVR